MPATKRKRIPKMSEARRKICLDNSCTEADMLNLQRELTEDLSGYAKLFKIELGEAEETGNKILTQFFSEKQVRDDKQRDRHLAMMRHRQAFAQLFGHSLQKFWDASLGFDPIAFDDIVVKSGDRATIEVLREKWGDGAVTMIKELMGLATGVVTT